MKLGDLCDVVRGSSPRPQGDPKYFGGNIPRLMIADITRDGKYVTPIIDSLTEEGAKKSRPMKKGDVVIAVSGDPGRPCILAIDACIHDGFVGLRNVDENKILKTYLFSFLNYFKLANKKNAVGAIFQNLTTDQIKKIEIPEISINNQKKIVQILDQTEKLLSQRKESIIFLDELLKSTFLEMFGDPVRNEKNWDKDTFDNLVDSDCPLTYGIVQPGEEFAKGVPVIRPVDLTKTYINRKGLKLIDPKISDKFKRTLLKGNEILMCVRGTTGVVALASEELEGCNVTRGIVPIWFSNDYNKFFGFGLLKTKAINNEIQNLTYGATLQQINLSDLRKIKLINPPLQLQNQYGYIVEKVETLKKEYEASLRELEYMYGVLSQKAFKGELNLSKVNIELYKEEIKTPVAGSLEPIIEVENPPFFQEKEKHIKDMSLDEYYGIPEDIIAKYGSIEEHHQNWEFILKKIFHDSPIDLLKLEEIYHKLYYQRGHDFEFEDWKAFIFKELSKSKSYLKQKFNTQTNQLELLINEINKS